MTGKRKMEKGLGKTPKTTIKYPPKILISVSDLFGRERKALSNISIA